MMVMALVHRGMVKRRLLLPMAVRAARPAGPVMVMVTVLAMVLVMVLVTVLVTVLAMVLVTVLVMVLVKAMLCRAAGQEAHGQRLGHPAADAAAGDRK